MSTSTLEVMDRIFAALFTLFYCLPLIAFQKVRHQHAVKEEAMGKKRSITNSRHEKNVFQKAKRKQFFSLFYFVTHIFPFVGREANIKKIPKR